MEIQSESVRVVKESFDLPGEQDLRRTQMPYRKRKGLSFVDDLSWISDSDYDVIVDLSEELARIRNHVFEVDSHILQKVVMRVNTINDPDEFRRVVRRAARLLGGITFGQPFFDGK